jgi:ribosomal protein S18 acetylase RimI-like enzyme
MTITRRINLGEWEPYRSIRLESLRESPDAFTSRYSDALARSEQSWAEQVDSSAEGPDRATFIAIRDSPVGLAALYRDEMDSDLGELIQMWVAPEARGGSVGNDLLAELFRWAGCNRFSRVKAEVMSSNPRALRFYEKSGFTVSAEVSILTAPSVVLTRSVESCAEGGGEGNE